MPFPWSAPSRAEDAGSPESARWEGRTGRKESKAKEEGNRDSLSGRSSRVWTRFRSRIMAGTSGSASSSVICRISRSVTGSAAPQERAERSAGRLAPANRPTGRKNDFKRGPSLSKYITIKYSTKTERTLAQGIYFDDAKHFIISKAVSDEERDIMLLYAQFLLIKYSFPFRQHLYDIDELGAFDNGEKWYDKNKKKFLENHPNTKYRPFLDNITVTITED